jgi:alpha-L-fucosidase
MSYIKKNHIMKKKASILILTLILSLSVVGQNGEDMKKMWGSDSSNISEIKKESKIWFQESKYAMFITWGLYSQIAGHWNNETFYGISEWIMKQKQIPVAKYKPITNDFNPVKFNAKEWVQLAKDAGMKYIVITAKHHDGFALFKSNHPFNIVDATPFKHDPLKDLAEACKVGGIKLGFYYSQNQDWTEINDWDPNHKNDRFNSYFENKAQTQVKELLTNYGELGLMWFDTPGNMTKEQSLSLVKTVNKLQPQALINSRIGNGVGDYSTYGDHQIPSRNTGGLWEAINTTNDSWGFTWYDENWKSPSQIAQDLVSVVARGGNYMLNIGPHADGTIPDMAAKFLRESGKWIKMHGDAIYGASPSPWQRAFSWGDCTVKGNKLYFFIYDWEPGSDLNIFGLKNKIKSVKIGEEKIKFDHEKDGWINFHLPLRKQEQLIEVIEVEIEGFPEVYSELSVDNTSKTIIGADFASTQGCGLGTSSWMEKFGTWKHVQSITNWDATNSQASWVINVKEPGTYFVDFRYNSFVEASENEWDVFTEHSSQLRFLSIGTTGAKTKGSWDSLRYRFRTVRAGTIHISKSGKQTITVKSANKLKGNGMQLEALHLTPLILY